MTTWTVFKRGEFGPVAAVGWVEVGTYDSDSPYWLGTHAAQTLGTQQGAGEYLLLSDERYKRITVVERTVYEEEVPPEPVGDSVEATMEREG